MLGYQAEWDRATDQVPFSNATDGDVWTAYWCENGCAHYDDCDLLMIALMGRTPYAWTAQSPPSPYRYACTEYRP